jgi:predicted small lipoprotein YifL
MSHWRRLWLLTLIAVPTTGCGLKGPLTLPSRSDEIVIRGPGQVTTEPATSPSTPATTPATTPARPQDERPPPPPLPGGNSGAASGG